MITGGATLLHGMADLAEDILGVPVRLGTRESDFPLKDKAYYRWYFTRLAIPCDRVFKVNEGRPNIVDHIVSGDVGLLINTPMGKASQYDDYAMRRAAITHNVPYLTTMSAASAACDALIALKSRVPSVRSLQDRIADVRPGTGKGGVE